MRNKKFTLPAASALAGVFLAGGIQHSNAQIIYTDIDPDLHLDPDGTGIFPEFINEFEPIDIDLDGDTDFSLMAAYDYYMPSSYSYLVKRNITRLVPVGGNGIAADEGTPDLFDPAHRYNAGAEINATAIWHDAMPFAEEAWLGDEDLIDGQLFCNDWLAQTYKFAGIRVKVGADYKYGWARISVDEIADGITLHDYAIQSAVNVPIIAGETGNCYPPSVSGTANVTTASAKLTWAPVYGATKYQIKYRKTGTPTWTTINAGAAAISKNISALDCNTEYEWKIRVRCAADFSDYSNTYSFTTLSCRIGDEENIQQIPVYPNPANATINIDLYDQPEGKYLIRIIDLSGKIIVETAAENHLTQINCSEFPAGLYLIQINDGMKMQVEKLVIE